MSGPNRPQHVRARDSGHRRVFLHTHRANHLAERLLHGNPLRHRGEQKFSGELRIRRYAPLLGRASTSLPGSLELIQAPDARGSGFGARGAKYGIAALHVPILDNSVSTIAQMNQLISFAQAHPPTYVHCEAGKGRTGTALACYRIAVDGWTPDQAIAEAKPFGLSLITDRVHPSLRGFARSGDSASEPGRGRPRRTEDVRPNPT